LSGGESDQGLDYLFITMEVGVGGPKKVACNTGVDSMLQFWLERGRRRDDALPKDETEAARSSWLKGK
jgi:hypothetical protein